MTADPYDLIFRLTATLQARMSKAGHPYALVTQEHLGLCSAWGCGDTCDEYRALFTEAVAWLDAHQPEAVAQLELTL